MRSLHLWVQKQFIIYTIYGFTYNVDINHYCRHVSNIAFLEQFEHRSRNGTVIQFVRGEGEEEEEGGGGSDALAASVFMFLLLFVSYFIRLFVYSFICLFVCLY